MEEEKNLGEKIAYQEQMINALKERIDKENAFKIKVKNEKLHNRKKNSIYRVLLIIAVVLMAIIVKFLFPYYFKGQSPGLLDATLMVALSVLFPFAAIFLGICIWKFSHYRKRVNKEIDTHDYQWRSYEDMISIAEENVMSLMSEEAKMVADLSVNQRLRDEIINTARIETEEGDMGKFISAEELNFNHAIEEKKEENLNPLSNPFLGGSRDINIVKLDDETRGFFYRFQAEYLPDSETAKCRYYESKYKQVYLVVMNSNEPIGICYGWPRAEEDVSDASFSLQGIAITAHMQGFGVGSKLLREFEKEVKKLGFGCVSVGSAGGYVEHFYSKNGYIPYSYKYMDDIGRMIEDRLLDEADYKRITRRRGGFVVFEKRL